MPPKKANRVKKPLKILVYGDSAVGKTHFALHATPGKTLIFDLEGGSDLYGGFVDFDFWTDDKGYKTQSYKELRKCIDYLKTKEGRENYETFILDPVTLIWTLLQQERQDYKEDKAVEKRNGIEKNYETDLENFTQRDWGIVKKMHKGIIDEVCNLTQNVILIAREKEIVEVKANGDIVRTGQYTFEGEKNLRYAVDYSFRLAFDERAKQRKAIIDKVRKPDAAIKKGDTIKDPTFETFRKISDSMKDAEEVKGVKTNTENTFTEAEKPPEISANSIKALHAIRNDLGKEEAEFKAGLSTMLKREIKSLKDITEPEARELIKTLNQFKERKAG